MRIWRTLMLAAVAAMLAACGRSEPPIEDGALVDGGSGAINLQQGWSAQAQQRAWFSSFGSRLIPTDWLLALEQPEGTTLQVLGQPLTTPPAPPAPPAKGRVKKK